MSSKYFVEFLYFENFFYENSNIWKSESQVKMSRYEPLFKCELKDMVLFSFSDLVFLGNYSTDKNHKINSLDFR